MVSEHDNGRGLQEYRILNAKHKAHYSHLLELSREANVWKQGRLLSGAGGGFTSTWCEGSSWSTKKSWVL